MMSRKKLITASVRHIARCLKSGIPICNSEVPDLAGRKTVRKREAILKCFAFHANAKKLLT